jgi:toxin ParE1/3/4
MALKLEFSAEAEKDFALILDHLIESYREFGEDPEEAVEHAIRRVHEIRRSAERILVAPHRGVGHDDILDGLRHLTIGRAIFRFDIDETRPIVRILAVFYGGQDHIRRMLTRLLSE